MRSLLVRCGLGGTIVFGLPFVLFLTLSYIPTIQHLVKASCNITDIAFDPDTCRPEVFDSDNCRKMYCCSVVYRYEVFVDGNRVGTVQVASFGQRKPAERFAEQHGMGTALRCYYLDYDPASSLTTSKETLVLGSLSTPLIFGMMTLLSLAVLLAGCLDGDRQWIGPRLLGTTLLPTSRTIIVAETVPCNKGSVGWEA